MAKPAPDWLADRTAETVTAWLQRYPGMEVIARDRVSAYAQACTASVPQAVQVADRFHVLMNLRETLERLFARHHADWRKVRWDKPAQPDAPRRVSLSVDEHFARAKRAARQ